MPFVSEKQRRYMWANHPDIAREWTDKYGSEPEDDDITMEARNKKVREKGKERGQRKRKKSR